MLRLADHVLAIPRAKTGKRYGYTGNKFRLAGKGEGRRLRILVVHSEKLLRQLLGLCNALDLLMDLELLVVFASSL